MEGRRAHAVAHLAYARSQKSGTGILGSKRVLQGGEKSSPLSVLRDLWLVYGVYGLGGEKWKCGPRSESVVQVKPWWREVWSVERNCGFGSSAGGGKCGPWGEIMVLGQTLVAGNVFQGEKLRPRVKLCPARVWSREQNRAPGQARPRRSMVQGEKLRPRVKPAPARVWSREPNCGPESSAPPAECGPGGETVPRVKPAPAQVWSREQNRGPGSNSAPPKCGPGSKTAALGQARPRPSVVQGAKPCPPGQARVPRSPPAPSPRPRT